MPLFRLASVACVLVLAFSAAQGRSETEMQTASWPNNDAAFTEFAREIAANHELNLLTFPGAKLIEAEAVKLPEAMHDGLAGVRAGDGRVQVNGNPSIITYYLGRPRSIREISVWTFNGDARSNQDFEVRVVDNSDSPGETPSFPAEPSFSSGDTVLGGDGGGFRTTFCKRDGGNLVDTPVDWVQFKIWRTYKIKAGSPAKKGRADSWTALIELQVLGDPNDPDLFASEAERKAWIAERTRRRVERRINELGPDIAMAIRNTQALGLAIDDLSAAYPDRFTRGAEYKTRLAQFESAFETLLAPESLAEEQNVDALLETAKQYDDFRREVLLANPLLDFETLLVRRSDNPGLVNNWISSCSRRKRSYGAEIQSLSPPKPDGELTTLVRPPGDSFIGDICLHWDAGRMLVTALGDNDRWQVFEVGTDGENLRQVTSGDQLDVDNAEACYLPDGGVIFSSNASMLGVPCVSGSQYVANLYRLEPDGQTIRQVTFEQDQDWCPVVLANGRVMYLRWEYTDNAHYFTRILMTMNPDGTNQMSYYGSNSYWPNSLFFAKPCPGHKTRFVGVVSGHHGTARAGELVLFDPAEGRKEADGAVQKIPGHGKPVEPVIVDRLVDASWPKFLHPAPLSDKYFLVSAKMNESSPWGIYLVDVFDNMVPILVEPGTGYFEPTPVIARETPPVIAPRIDPERSDAVVYLSDIYSGPGLAGVPRGEVKRLRLFSYGYGYRNIGGHDRFGMESSWDAKRILGTVPVKEDGSAVFRVPANTPISLQPLDEQGRALQLMRSWLVAMPGEVLSCVGCHESQDTVPAGRFTSASLQHPDDIEPWYGPARPFGFEHEVQPVLNEYCVGCHNGFEEDVPDFADTTTGPQGFSMAYHALHGYVRRPGPESDVHVLRPLEYHASTSELFQILEKGHQNVDLDREAWERLYCWADLNVPYFGTWTEMTDVVSGGKTFRGDKAPLEDVASRYFELRSLYATAALDMESEARRPLPPRVKFVRPAPVTSVWPRPTNPRGWPLSSAEAKRLQAADAESTRRVVRLDDETEIMLTRIPAGTFIMGDSRGEPDENPACVVEIDRPYWMMATEVTNALFRRYFPEHDSRYIDQQWKDHTTPGYPHNLPEQPVIRITWTEAMEFCRRLSDETGFQFDLPTEAEWEWACRAGTDTPLWFGDANDDFARYANLADEQLRNFVVKGVNPKPVKHDDYMAFIPRAEGIDDGQMIPTAKAAYTPNPWGLYDAHGGVAEWTRSDFAAYPYVSDDGRNAGDARTPKVVRGGSWRDRPWRARSAHRLSYAPWQRVFNVGFRAICREEPVEE